MNGNTTSPDLVIVDGPAVIYRAFYAVEKQNLQTSWGEDVGATFVATRMMWNLIREQEPRYMIAVWDRGFSGREAIQKAYKVQRPPTPPSLVRQKPYIRAIWEALGMVHAEQEGYEADDLAATLARQACERGLHTWIVTSDKDMLQLVNDCIQVYDPATRPPTLYTPEKVEEKFGLPPERLREYLALVGDSVDNIPGIDEVGPKTAQEILKHIRLDELPEALFHLPLKLRKKIHPHEALIRQNLQMVTLKTLPVNLEDFLRPRREDRKTLREWFRRMEFFSLLEEVCEDLTVYPLTDGPLPGEGAVVPDDGGFVVAGEGRCVRTPRLPEGTWMAFDSKAVFRIQEVEVAGDLSLGVYLLEPDLGRYSPRDVALAFGGVRLPEGPEAVATLTHRLFPEIRRKLEEEGLIHLLLDLEIPVAWVLARMEKRGIPVNVGRLQEARREVMARLHALEEEIYALAGERFNLRSSRQLARILFEKIGLKAIKRTQTGFSTDASVLSKLAQIHPLPAKILEYREVEKIRSSYLDNLFQHVNPETGRIYPTFEQKAAATGRIVTRDPNLQTLPVRGDFSELIRRAFVAPSGWVFLSADYSQIELRILAHLSGDETLRKAFLEGRDIHAETASRVFGKPPEAITPEERRMAKGVNFGIVYGISPYGLSESLGIPMEEARELIERTLQAYAGVVAWMEKTEAEALRTGEVRTLLGRRRRVALRRDLPQPQYEALRRVAINTPVQGSAADVIKLAMVRIERMAEAAGLPGGMILQIHDELVLEVPEDSVERWKEVLREGMERMEHLGLSVPLEVSFHTGTTLADLLK